jgi:hypothetical protein
LEAISYDGKYKLPSTLSNQLIYFTNKVKQESYEIKKQKLVLENELKRVKNQTAQSYMEMFKVSNHLYLSTDDFKKHRELQDKALKWLFQHSFIAVTEFTLPNGKRTDLFAYSESQIIIFDIKFSDEDLITDLK